MAAPNKNTLQKILSILIIFLVPIFIVREYKVLKPKNGLFFSLVSEPSVNEFSKSADKSFFVLIFCNEASDFCDKNLISIFSQTYSHYRVIFVGDDTQGGNFKKTQAFVHARGYNNMVTFIPWDHKTPTSSLLYQTIQNCRDDEVIVHLEPSDWFAHNQVLEKLNQIYLDPDVWLTYGECLTYPTLEHTKLKPPANKTLSEYGVSKAPWMSSHLKTYYAGLAKQLSLQDNKDHNLPTSTSQDKMLLTALLKMSQWHIRFIPEALYVHTPQDLPPVKKSKYPFKN